jgi:DNA invertase Pin-like site-specific DNA recombinase
MGCIPSLSPVWCLDLYECGLARRLICELLVTILAGFATFERHLIKARTDDGRKRAKARGVRFGRPRKLDQHQRQEAIERLAKGESLVDVARTYGVAPITIGRLPSPFAENVAA